MKHIQGRRNILKTFFIGLSVFFLDLRVKADSQIREVNGNIWLALKSRRSVRKFKSNPVPDKHINEIVEAAHFAPSPRNRQAWKFLVIKDRSILDKIKEECIKRSGEESRQYYEDYLSAPVSIVVLADTRTRSPINDITAGALAAENLMLAARALGYGSVFCVNSIPEDVTRKILNIPNKYRRICITPIGIPDEWPETPTKKPLEEIIVYDRF
jgi:nitroreductase